MRLNVATANASGRAFNQRDIVSILPSVVSKKDFSSLSGGARAPVGARFLF